MIDKREAICPDGAERPATVGRAAPEPAVASAKTGSTALMDRGVRRPPAMLSARHVVALQQTAGNAAVSRLLQRDPAPVATPPTPDPKVTELQTQATRLKNQQRATLLLDQFKEEVLIRITGWEIAILNLGSAYARAAKNHSEAVEKKKKADAIKSQVMFSVLTVASAGGLAWVSGLVQAAKAAKGAAAETSLLTNVLEDVLQNSAAEAFSANGPGVHQRVPTADQTAVSDDPLVFQNQRMGRLKAAQLQAHTQFKTFTADLLNRPDADWDKYDEKAQTAPYAAWLAQADVLSANVPSVDVMADELERGFWAKWAPALRDVRGEIDNTEQISYRSPSTAVEERFDALGITKASGVGDFGWWTSDKEIIKVITWANGYQVKPFIA